MLFAQLITFVTLAQVNPILNVDHFKLESGLSVFLNRDTTANQVFGAIMVNAGAKHEDPNATGMAHYLEHMLFKGTDQYGTTDFAAEKPYLDSISVLYEKLALTKEEDQKVEIQQLINDQAVQASKFGLPNEFDTMLKSIGATGVNAFTNYEMTFYHNLFPSHEIEKWLVLYAERFREPVFRSFQSELEVVYEEKNRAMDNFERRIYEEVGRQMFPNLPYGQWSVLGTVEHLKTPSLERMYAFYEDNYVAENMALILSGNFDAEKVKSLIKREYSDFRPGKPKVVSLPKVEAIKGEKRVKKRMTPIKAGFLGYQTVGMRHPDRIALSVAEYLLSNNSETGYINQLMNEGEMIYSGGIPMHYNDEGAIVFFYVPKILVQSLGNAEKKMKMQIQKVKDGDFSDDLLESAKNDLIAEFNARLDNLTSRGILIGGAFNIGFDWDKTLTYPALVDAITKEDIQRVAQQYFGENLLKMTSRTGFPKKTKLDKPGFKAVKPDDKVRSTFYTDFQQLPSEQYEPKFLDFVNDVDRFSFQGGHTILASTNPINDFFELTIRYHIGRLSDPELIEMTDLFENSGAGDFELTQLKERFSSLGISYNFRTYQNAVDVSLSGREDNLEAGLRLLNQLFQKPRMDEKAKKVYVNKTVAEYKLEEQNLNLMGRALYDFATFGRESFYLSRKSKNELKSIDENALIQKGQRIFQEYSTTTFFSGNTNASELAEMLQTNLPMTEEEKRAPFRYLEGKSYDANTIFFVHQKKAIQSQVYFHVSGGDFKNSDFPRVQAFNSYFGDGFTGLVLQEIREYRSLAYSAGSVYVRPAIPDKKGRLLGYIGCQGDKTGDAIPVMIDLLKEMPRKEERMEALRSSLQLKTVTQYPNFRQKPSRIYNYELNGFHEDPNKKAFNGYSSVDMDFVSSFYEENIRGNPYVITIYGDKRKVDLDQLRKFGEVVELSQEDFIKF